MPTLNSFYKSILVAGIFIFVMKFFNDNVDQIDQGGFSDPTSKEFIFNYVPQEMLNPAHESTMKEIKKYRIGFRSKKQIVTKPSEFDKDFERVPERYLRSKTIQKTNIPSIEGNSISGPKSCPKADTIIMIKSALHHFNFRQAARDTWIKDLDNFPNMAYLFTVASTEDSEKNEKLQEEKLIYNDILQADCIDSYYNVTKKVMMGMNFVVENCQFLKYVIHIDDDAYVSPFRYMNNIYKHFGEKDSPANGEYIDCGVPTIRTSPVIRPNTTKHPEWSMTEEAFDKDAVPNYCNGPCYGIPFSTYKKIYETTRRVNFEPIEKLDDLILTGVIRAQFKWPLYETSGMFCWHLDNKLEGVDKKMYGWYNLGKQQSFENVW